MIRTAAVAVRRGAHMGHRLLRGFKTEHLPSDTFIKDRVGKFERLARAARFIDALSPVDRVSVTGMIRVDHSGEVAANTIYEAQSDVLGFQGRRAEKDLIMEMWENEKKHLAATRAMLDEYRTRPSALVPLWALAGRVLGGVTALLGKKSAMACTEAVETVIGEHYDDQLAHLDKIESKLKMYCDEAQKKELQENIGLLRSVLIEFRDDELEHLDTAVEHDSQQAPAHALLSAVVEAGCKSAIEIAKRV